MKDSINSLTKINNSIKEIVTDETTSSELKLAAINLGVTITPCLEEIKEAILRFQETIKPCYETLQESEKIYLNKERFASISPAEILEEIGNLTGQTLKIKKLTAQSQQEISNKIALKWQDKSQEFKYQHFKWEQNKQKFNKDTLEFFEKDALFRTISNSIDEIAALLNTEITGKCQLIEQQLTTIFSPSLTSYLDSFKAVNIEDNKIDQQIIEGKEQLNLHLKTPLEFLPENYQSNYIQVMLNPFNNVNIKSTNVGQLFRLYLQEVEQLCLEIENIAVKLINDILQQKADLTINLINQIIQFYKNLIEKQQRYKGELSSIFTSEKAWLEQQKQELNHIDNELKTMLNSLEIN